MSDLSGILSRKHIHATSFIDIGKEANRIEVTMPLGVDDEYVETYPEEDQ